MARFFFSTKLSLPVPADTRFYYWLYPHQRIALVNGAVTKDLQRASFGFWRLMKFYPLAFAVVEIEHGFSLPHHDLATFRTSHADETVDVPLRLYPVPHEYEVEAPLDSQIIGYGRDAISAEQRAAKARILDIPAKQTDSR